MHKACKEGHLEVAQWLCKVGAAIDVSAQTRLLWTPMHMACQGGHFKIVQWLCEIGAQQQKLDQWLRARDQNGETPMHRACQGGFLEVAKLLYKNGAAEDVTSRDNHNETPMVLACFRGFLDVAKWLHQVGAAEVPCGTSTLPIHGRGSIHALVVDLALLFWIVLGCPPLTHSCLLAQDVCTPGYNGRTPLSSACEAGHLGVAEWLFTVGASEGTRARDRHGETPLLGACKSNHLDVAKWLLSVGNVADLRVTNNFGVTPFSRCCKRGYLDFAKWLLSAGAHEDLTAPDANGYTPLCVATNSGHVGVAQWLLLMGAADDESGHVDTAIVQDEVKMALMEPLRSALLQLLEERAKFCAIVLPAVCGGPVVCGGVAGHSGTAGEPGPSKRVLTWPALVSSTCPLQLLRGHEDTLLALVADFAGVPHGRKLRTLREAVQCLEDDADDEADYDEEIPGSLLPFSAAGAAWS